MGPAAELAAALGARRSSGSWVARCPAHQDRKPSLSIAESADGRLLLHCFAGCSWATIRAELQAKRLWPDTGHSRLAPRQLAQRRPAKRPPKELRQCVTTIWRNAGAAPGSPVGAYLRGRGIDLALPATLRHARLWHTEARLRLPCMVAAVQDGRGALTGVHRTFLQPDGHAKANVTPVKKMLGRCRGATLRLTSAAIRLTLCEGIETGLSIRQACPELAVWCALSAGNLDQLTLPPAVEEVVLVADGDPVGRAAAYRAAQRYGATDRRVRVVDMPCGMDANDLLRAPT